MSQQSETTCSVYTKHMCRLVVIAHNIRSSHNIGSLFRSCDGFGVDELILSGYTPYPTVQNDPRLPHIHQKITRDIHKTALGAEQTVAFRRTETPPLEQLKADGYRLVALEQYSTSTALATYRQSGDIALLLGEEVAGITSDLLTACDDIVEIPMKGQKESFNVSVAAAIALYHLVYMR